MRPPPSTVSFDIEGLQLAASPWISILSFTHIFGKSLDKGIAKAEVISISTMAIVLPGSFIKSVCKMWVKDRISMYKSIRGNFDLPCSRRYGTAHG